MRKLSFAVIGAITLMLSSCIDKSTVEVQVINKHEHNVLDNVAKYAFDFQLYDAVTPAGDTVVIHVPEKICLVTKVPYTALMEKNSTETYGVVTEVSSK